MSTVSVALAAWRGEKWIGAQLESLLAQERVPDEIVICDDSPDSLTGNAVEPFLRRDSRIHYHRNLVRLGICRNFEAAFRRCTGEFIFPADQDDVWDRGKVARLCRELEDHPECELVFCDSRVVDGDGRELGYSAWELQGRTLEAIVRIPAGELEEQLLIRPLGYAHDMAFRRTLLETALPFPSIEACHDFWLASLAAAQGRLRVVPERLTAYRCHTGNYTQVERGGFTARLRELIRRGRSERERTGRLYAALAERLAAVDLSPERRELIEGLAAYHLRRGAGHLASWHDYRRFGQGVRSLLRDLLLF